MNTGKIGDFRNDINGLRAFAVIAVVLYHFGIPGFSGGFIGVDVFFVISGYLMTRMILVAIESDSFSLSSFYLARAKRIIPALLVVCGTLLFAGWFMPLTEFEYRQLSKHVRDSLFFISNHTYSREAGYFDSASHEKWLLHTWSLSLEWQFYLFLPWIILLLNKFHQKVNARRALIILTATSFLAGIYETHTHPEIAFYILPFRAWELLAGGLLYVFA